MLKTLLPSPKAVSGTPRRKNIHMANALGVSLQPTLAPVPSSTTSPQAIRPGGLLSKTTPGALPSSRPLAGLRPLLV